MTQAQSLKSALPPDLVSQMDSAGMDWNQAALLLNEVAKIDWQKVFEIGSKIFQLLLPLFVVPKPIGSAAPKP